MITRTVQIICPHHWRVCRMALAQTALAIRSGLSHVMTFVALALALVGCAEFNEFRSLRTDIAYLRSDLNTNSAALVTIASRVDDLERRQSIPGSGAGHSPQELTRAVDVLLKKALETESRLSSIEAGRSPVKTSEKSTKQTRQPVSESRASVAPKGTDQNGSPPTYQSAPASQKPSPAANALSLGMTSEEVRRALGDPVSTETSESYIFWHYSRVTHQRYVIFEKDTGQVSGWWGL